MGDAVPLSFHCEERGTAPSIRTRQRFLAAVANINVFIPFRYFCLLGMNAYMSSCQLTIGFDPLKPKCGDRIVAKTTLSARSVFSSRSKNLASAYRAFYSGITAASSGLVQELID